MTVQTRPWVRDLEEPPPLAADLPERLAELRACVQEPAQTTKPERCSVDRANPRVVPPEIYASLAKRAEAK